MTDLLQLKNIGNTSAHWLQSVGIADYDALKAAGPIQAYLLVEAKGIKTSKVFLYALQGALMDVQWNDLSPEMKEQLLNELEAYKSNAQNSNN